MQKENRWLMHCNPLFFMEAAGNKKKTAFHKETLASQCKTQFFPSSLPSSSPPVLFLFSFHSCRRYNTFLLRCRLGERYPTDFQRPEKAD